MTFAIPEWWSVEAKRQTLGNAGLTALEAFILANEPADPADAEAFRVQLSRVLQDAAVELPS